MFVDTPRQEEEDAAVGEADLARAGRTGDDGRQGGGTPGPLLQKDGRYLAAMVPGPEAVENTEAMAEAMAATIRCLADAVEILKAAGEPCRSRRSQGAPHAPAPRSGW
jgi:hypothetical protein